MREPLGTLLHGAALVGVVTCLGAMSASAQTVPLEIAPNPSADVVALEEGGLQRAIDTLPATIADVMERSGVPGLAVAVVSGGETVLLEGYGVRELGHDETIDAETVFQIASLSKPIAGTVATIAVHNEVTDWDAKAIRYLPHLMLGDAYVTENATLGDFFSHRSGLYTGMGDDLEDIGYDRAAILERLRLLPLDTFRLSYNYSNFGFTIAGEAVAAAAGTTWEDLAETTLFQPLGMTSTSYRFADFMAHENRATPHAFIDGTFQPRYQRDPDPQAPAGGVSSSATDLAEWLKLLLANGATEGEPLFTEADIVPAMRPQSFSGPTGSLDARSSFYGFGFGNGVGANGRLVVSHSGAFVLGTATRMELLPSADVGIVILTNGAPIGVPEALAAHFMDVVQYGAPTRDWFEGYNSRMVAFNAPVGDLAGETPPAEPAPSHRLTEFTGTYKNAYYGDAEVTLVDGALVLALGPGGFTLPMTHWDGDTFAVSPATENLPTGSLSSVAFTFDPSSPVALSFTVDVFNRFDLGTWTR